DSVDQTRNFRKTKYIKFVFYSVMWLRTAFYGPSVARRAPATQPPIWQTKASRGAQIIVAKSHVPLAHASLLRHASPSALGTRQTHALVSPVMSHHDPSRHSSVHGSPVAGNAAHFIVAESQVSSSSHGTVSHASPSPPGCSQVAVISPVCGSLRAEQIN